MEFPSHPATVDELVARMRSDLDGTEAVATTVRNSCEGPIALAQLNADIGAEPPLRPWQGALRPVARAVARAVLYLSRFIIDAQIRFNRHVLTTLTILDEGTRQAAARGATQAEQTRDRLLEMERTLWRLRGEMARLTPHDAPAVANPAQVVPDADALDELYAALEERFRGPRAVIKERLREYLPVLDAAGIGTADHLIDVGCGRGEWLELLRERGWRGQGVDGNGHMIARCRALDLDVVHADAIAYLRGLSSGSVAVLTAFHVAEHLQFPALVALFDEAARVLRRDGVFLIETPNPDYPEVATRDFYLDPTHWHPLPPALVSFLAEAKGFDRIAVVSAHANRPALDYALIARRR